MTASPIYRRLPSKKTTSLRRYVSQRSLAVLLFIALAVVASVENKSAGKRKSRVGSSIGISQPSDQQRYLSLNPRQLVENIVGSIKDAFNDPALIEYANDQGADIPYSQTTPFSRTSPPISIISKSRSDQPSKPSSSD